MENSFRLTSSSVSDRGLSDKRPVNEDSFLDISEIGLFAVADGVGGAQAGDVASQMAMEILSEAFANRREGTDAEDVMRLAIQSANQAINQMSIEIPQLSSMATTIAAIHVQDNIATVAHVGDSRVYRILPDGSIRRETADHSVVEEEVRAGRMTPEQALVHPSRNVISRALGAESTVDVELKTIMIESATMFLLCSDGITRHISDSELEELFNHEIEPDVLVQQMREICYSRGAEDNLTAVVVRVMGDLAGVSTNGSGLTVAEFEKEEETIAATRSPFDSLAEETLQGMDNEYSAIERNKEDIETVQQSLDDESYLISESEDIEPAQADKAVVEETPPPASSAMAAGSAEPVRAAESSYNFQTLQEDRPKGPSKAFSSILLFVLGLVLGGAGYYFYQQSFPPADIPVLNEPKSSNIPLSSYEELRQNVDADPVRYAAQFAPTPKDAIDHYFLARSLMLQDKRPEARQQLLLAKSRLDQLPPESSRSLSIEIALALSMLDNPAAADSFAKELSNSGGTGNPPANSNANSAAPLR